jgi:hypothetical protein
MRQVLTPDDLKKGDLIEPGWYPVEFFKYDEEDASDEAKNPGSTNCLFFFKVIDGPAKGMEVKRLFNETAMGFGKNLWPVLQLPAPDGKSPGSKEKGYLLETEAFKSKLGTKLQIYVKRGKSNRGNEFNDVQDFRPL